VFRSLGALARAIGPVAACLVFWWLGAPITYAMLAAVVLLPWIMALPLPKPEK
jgi:hypothetical protein